MIRLTERVDCIIGAKWKLRVMKEKKGISNYAKYEFIITFIKLIRAFIIAITLGGNKVIKNDTLIKSARFIEFNIERGLGEVAMQSLIKYELSYIKERTLSAIEARGDLNTFNNIIAIRLKEEVEQISKNIGLFLFYNTLVTLLEKLILLIESFLIRKSV